MRARQLEKNRIEDAKKKENSSNVVQATLMHNLEYDNQQQDRQLKEYMHDNYKKEMEARQRNKDETKKALHAMENKRIEEQERKFIKTDRAQWAAKTRFI